MAVGAAVLALVGGFTGALWWFVTMFQGAELRRHLAAVGAAGDLEVDLPSEVVGRFAAIERRMEQLEQDALTYLRKGSQRAEQARRRENRNNSSEAGEEPVASDEEREQLELTLAGGQNGPATQAVASLSDVRGRM